MPARDAAADAAVAEPVAVEGVSGSTCRARPTLGDPLVACGHVPESEHGAKRVTDQSGLAELERVEDVVDQPTGELAHMPAAEGKTIRQPVPREVHREHPEMMKFAEQRCPHGALSDTP
jgi:ferredoxin